MRLISSVRLITLLLVAVSLAFGQAALPVTGISAAFQNGQTFITWSDPYTGAAGANYRYNVYWSTSAIVDPTTLAAATLIEANVFNNSGQRTSQFPYSQTTRQDNTKLMSITVQGSCGGPPANQVCGTQLAAFTGLAVHTVRVPASSYYAVITHDTTGALTDSAVTPGSNATTTPVTESIASIQPLKYYDSTDTTHVASGWQINPASTNLPLWINLHASGGCAGAITEGSLYNFWGDPSMSYQDGTQQTLAVGQSTSAFPYGHPASGLSVHPCDTQWLNTGTGQLETNWLGYVDTPLGQYSFTGTVSASSSSHTLTVSSPTGTLALNQNQYHRAS